MCVKERETERATEDEKEMEGEMEEERDAKKERENERESDPFITMVKSKDLVHHCAFLLLFATHKHNMHPFNPALTALFFISSIVVVRGIVQPPIVNGWPGLFLFFRFLYSHLWVNTFTTRTNSRAVIFQFFTV